MEEKKTTKLNIILTDILFLTPFVAIALFGFLAILFVGTFIGVCSIIFLVKSFSLGSIGNILGGLAISVFMLISTAIFAYIDCIVVKKTMSALDNYFTSRKQALNAMKVNQ